MVLLPHAGTNSGSYGGIWVTSRKMAWQSEATPAPTSKETSACCLIKQRVWWSDVLVVRIMELLRLEKTIKMIESNS